MGVVSSEVAGYLILHPHRPGAAEWEHRDTDQDLSMRTVDSFTVTAQTVPVLINTAVICFPLVSFPGFFPLQ